MKNQYSNFDPKILEEQLLNDIFSSSGENNNIIRELFNKILYSNGINTLTHNFGEVSIYFKLIQLIKIKDIKCTKKQKFGAIG